MVRLDPEPPPLAGRSFVQTRVTPLGDGRVELSIVEGWASDDGRFKYERTRYSEVMEEDRALAIEATAILAQHHFADVVLRPCGHFLDEECECPERLR